MKNEKGFTLVEMLVVMLIISVLLILIIPNVMRYQRTIQERGCEAFVRSVQGQVQGYMLENDGRIPTVNSLLNSGYITQDTCPMGERIIIANDGTVSVTE